MLELRKQRIIYIKKKHITLVNNFPICGQESEHVTGRKCQLPIKTKQTISKGEELPSEHLRHTEIIKRQL